jgi:hypothetical protein
MGDMIWPYLIDANWTVEPSPGQRIAFGEGAGHLVSTYGAGHGR